MPEFKPGQRIGYLTVVEVHEDRIVALDWYGKRFPITPHRLHQYATGDLSSK